MAFQKSPAIIACIVGIIGIVAVLAITEKAPLTSDCPVMFQAREVRGSSLEPLVAAGSTVKLAMDKERCVFLERGDIVAYQYAGNPDTLLLKIVRGIPGDRFNLKHSENNTRHLVMNDKILKNSQGEEYILDERAYQLLSLYERSYKGVIPKGTYLLLGNNPRGSKDSTTFGLVDRSGILGKVTP